MPLLRCDSWCRNTQVLLKVHLSHNQDLKQIMDLIFSCKFLSLIAGLAGSTLTGQEVGLQFNVIFFSFFLLCMYKEGNWSKKRKWQASGHDLFGTVNLSKTFTKTKSRPYPQQAPHPLLDIYWVSQVTQWVWLHFWRKLQLIFKQQLSASKLITELQVLPAS